MADVRVRKRKRMREKDVKALNETFQQCFGIAPFSDKDAVDLAESSDFNIIFINNEMLGMVYQERPFLTVRGLIKYRPEKRWVTVDMGAVPYVTNGADVMGPGILDADPDIKENDLVWIRDIKNKTPLAVGLALRDSAGLRSKDKGKAITTIHYVGDKLWKSGE
jgi:PUA-domain protein